jgi:hypothetical protein
VAKDNNQTGLASGSSPTRVRQEIACGAYDTAVPTPMRVVLPGPWKPFPTVDDQQVLMLPAWPWWSLEGLHACGRS